MNASRQRPDVEAGRRHLARSEFDPRTLRPPLSNTECTKRVVPGPIHVLGFAKTGRISELNR